MQYAAYGATKMEKEVKGSMNKTNSLVELLGCLLVPLLVFLLVFYLRSFDSHYKSESSTDVMCYCVLIVPFAAGMNAFSMRKIGDPKPMALLALMALAAWLSAVMLGEYNFHFNMRPFYDVRQLNVYPSVDTAKYSGQSLMDAGILEFAPGTQLVESQSMGFKNHDVYCVAPIASGTGNQSTYDFWAVGMNCCSGHRPEKFHCGDYFPLQKSMKGLRVMDDDKRDMFRLVVKKAEAEFNLKVNHPVFVYWLSDPEAELQAYQDDGWQYFVTASFAFFCIQLLVVVVATVAFAKL